MEKTIKVKGIVKGFSKIEVGTKKDNSQYAYVEMFLLDNKYSYRLFFDTPEIIQEKVFDRVPVGSTVEFIIYKSGNYWNVDNKSFDVLIEGDGSIPQSNKPSNEDLYEKRYIVRQNALSHADAKRANTKMPDNEYFEFAEKCEKWVLRD